MPHLVLEYSHNLTHTFDSAKLLMELHQEVVSSELFASQDIHIRSQDYSQYLVGGRLASFVHLAVVVEPRHDFGEKKRLSNALLAVLAATFPKVEHVDVETREAEHSCVSQSRVALQAVDKERMYCN
ncbi:hypothetical protein [Motilimonas sp. 1_MG-2023]|uniref:hypothetical protein n=1 Tax=Motilimonas TaxID=1914248 RepID=UPI001E3012FB|nr:hypothetical protein [Motilimonas sp. 1_MG-2023]MCE0559006.1 hypothetical protein [Motilimonas sp. E26]MDO6525240.1 hypothetical protein [Motilimonas sp. 1_MG-2023]